MFPDIITTHCFVVRYVHCIIFLRCETSARHVCTPMRIPRISCWRSPVCQSPYRNWYRSSIQGQKSAKTVSMTLRSLIYRLRSSIGGDQLFLLAYILRCSTIPLYMTFALQFDRYFGDVLVLCVTKALYTTSGPAKGGVPSSTMFHHIYEYLKCFFLFSLRNIQSILLCYTNLSLTIIVPSTYRIWEPFYIIFRDRVVDVTPVRNKIFP